MQPDKACEAPAADGKGLFLRGLEEVKDRIRKLLTSAPDCIEIIAIRGSVAHWRGVVAALNESDVLLRVGWVSQLRLRKVQRMVLFLWPPTSYVQFVYCCVPV